MTNGQVGERSANSIRAARWDGPRQVAFELFPYGHLVGGREHSGVKACSHGIIPTESYEYLVFWWIQPMWMSDLISGEIEDRRGRRGFEEI